MDNELETVDPTLRCSTCEAVCCRLTVVLMPEDTIPARLTDRESGGLEVMARGEDGWCVALDARTMRCSIYETRPTICREFAMGGRACAEERINWYKHSSKAGADTLTAQLRTRTLLPKK